MTDPTIMEMYRWYKDHPCDDPLLPQNVFRSVWNCLDCLSPTFRELIRTLDYANHNTGSEPVGSDLDTTLVDIGISPGGSEGVYIDWHIISEGTRIRVGTLKTLDEGFDAYVTMGKLVGIITLATNTYLEEVL